MAKVDIIMPKMGESVAEATIINWLKNIGESVESEESIIEIATDKVDSEIPSPTSGILIEQKCKKEDVIKVGEVIGIIETSEESQVSENTVEPKSQNPDTPTKTSIEDTDESKDNIEKKEEEKFSPSISSQNRFYSPLVKKIAQKENIDQEELDKIEGTGKNERVTKRDILKYVQNKGQSRDATTIPAPTSSEKETQIISPPVSISAKDEIIEMDRMRKIIADHMVMSKHTSPHVTSFVEADLSNIVIWRNKIKNDFLKREGEKITYTPIFIEAVAKALRDFPMVNVSLDNNNIIKKKDVNIGMATALSSGNLIVPVIKNADQMNLVGLTKRVNDLAKRARENKLNPDEIQGGTFTISNVGSFGNVMGTPIINQPQAGILAVGVIKKKPVVIETSHGDTIGIRHMMFLSHSYDHRIVDGALGGSFVRCVADHLENFNINRNF